MKNLSLFILAFLFFHGICLADNSFISTKTDYCIFLYYPENRNAVNSLIKNSDRIVKDISETTGFKTKGRTRIIIVPSYSDFQKVQPRGEHVPIWAVGVAYPSRNLVIILKKNRVDLIKTFRHEMTHIMLGQYFSRADRIPRWLNEGLAMIVAGDWSMSRLSTITAAVLTDSLIPMDEIVDSFPGDVRDAELAYCQSFYFISFLKGRFGRDAFRQFLSEYAKHGDFESAIQRTYKMSWSRMEDQWLKYMEARFSWIPILTSTGFLWFFATIIFIVGYFHKKKKARQKLEQWKLEEEYNFYDDED